MHTEIFEVDKLPVAVIDDFYDKEAEKKIWNEILFLSSGDKMHDPGDTGTAFDLDEHGNQIWAKKNKGLFLDEIYLDRNISDILRENRKIFDPEIHNHLIDYNPIFRHLTNVNKDCTLLSYYEDSDYYNPHVDDAAVTIISWFFKHPKQFTGGSLVFENKLDIECVYNRTVIFPSILKHAVTPVSIDEQYKNKNYGRYTLTQLCMYR